MRETNRDGLQFSEKEKARKGWWRKTVERDIGW